MSFPRASLTQSWRRQQKREPRPRTGTQGNRRKKILERTGGRSSFLGLLCLGNASNDVVCTDRRWEAELYGRASLRLAADNAPSDAETRRESASADSNPPGSNCPAEPLLTARCRAASVGRFPGNTHADRTVFRQATAFGGLGPSNAARNSRHRLRYSPKTRSKLRPSALTMTDTRYAVILT